MGTRYEMRQGRLVQIETVEPEQCDRTGCHQPAVRYVLLISGAVYLCERHACEAERVDITVAR